MANKPVKFKTGYVIGNRWYMIKKIGSGTFGTVFECVDLVTKLHVAIKIEFANPYKHTLMLKHEKNILEKLQDRAHFCSFFQYGVQFQNNYPYKESFYYLAMELQGENFSKLQNVQPNGVFSIATTLRLGYRLLKAIESMHLKGFLHRDIKPKNIVISQNARDIFLVDFGLSRKYTNEFGKILPERNLPPNQNGNITGTANYVSTNGHKFKDLGRHDDLWSFYYTMVEFLKGQNQGLPWVTFKYVHHIHKKKEEFNAKKPIEYLSLHSKVTRQIRIVANELFEPFLEHLRSLKYEDEPDYSMLLGLFEKCMYRLRIKDSFNIFSQTELQNIQKKKKTTYFTIPQSQSNDEETENFEEAVLTKDYCDTDYPHLQFDQNNNDNRMDEYKPLIKKLLSGRNGKWSRQRGSKKRIDFVGLGSYPEEDFSSY